MYQIGLNESNFCEPLNRCPSPCETRKEDRLCTRKTQRTVKEKILYLRHQVTSGNYLCLPPFVILTSPHQSSAIGQSQANREPPRVVLPTRPLSTSPSTSFCFASTSLSFLVMERVRLRVRGSADGVSTSRGGASVSNTCLWLTGCFENDA